MPLLGKVLTVCNLVAALAFFCLAAADWGARHKWAYAVFEHDLAIQGLPLTADETDVQGNRRVADLGTAALQKLFQPVGGNPVKTQEEEIDRLQNHFRGEIEGISEPAEKRNKLLAFLLPLAVTVGERDALYRARPEELMSSLDEVFNQAKALTNPEEKRRAFARLLVTHNLTQDSPDQPPRALVVVGLAAYVQTVDDQAAALQDLTQRVQLTTIADSGAFESAYKAKVEAVQLQARRLEGLLSDLQDQQKLVERHGILLNARKADVEQLEQQLREARKSTADARKAQADLKSRVSEAQRSLEEARETNQRLERQISDLELKGTPR
jgi:hypothetical protein